MINQSSDVDLINKLVHIIKTPLSTISMALKNLEYILPESSEHSKKVEESKEIIYSAAKSVEQINSRLLLLQLLCSETKPVNQELAIKQYFEDLVQKISFQSDIDLKFQCIESNDLVSSKDPRLLQVAVEQIIRFLLAESENDPGLVIKLSSDSKDQNVEICIFYAIKNGNSESAPLNKLDKNHFEYQIAEKICSLLKIQVELIDSFEAQGVKLQLIRNSILK